jgi:hypothetical protein
MNAEKGERVVAGEVHTRICVAVLCGQCTVWNWSGVFGRGLMVGSYVSFSALIYSVSNNLLA